MMISAAWWPDCPACGARCDRLGPDLNDQPEFVPLWAPSPLLAGWNLEPCGCYLRAAEWLLTVWARPSSAAAWSRPDEPPPVHPRTERAAAPAVAEQGEEQQEMAEQQVPSKGRNVHYRQRGSKDGVYAPRCATALVTKVGDDERVNLTVFPEDGGFFQPADVAHDEGQAEGGTWHWPERVGPTSGG
jgi:hypothetical protein